MNTCVHLLSLPSSLFTETVLNRFRTLCKSLSRRTSYSKKYSTWKCVSEALSLQAGSGGWDAVLNEAASVTHPFIAAFYLTGAPEAFQIVSRKIRCSAYIGYREYPKCTQRTDSTHWRLNTRVKRKSRFVSWFSSVRREHAHCKIDSAPILHIFQKCIFGAQSKKDKLSDEWVSVRSTNSTI